MKTKLAVSALALVVSLSVAGCYTEFATTGGNYGGYGSSYGSGYYTSADSGYAYDTTSAPVVNNYISNYYGTDYSYPYYGGSLYYQNMFVPDMGWWNTDSWMFGIGIGGWYGSYPYYGGYAYGGYSMWPYGYSPYYNYYSPYSYYGSPLYSSYYPYYTPWWPYSYYSNSSGLSARTRNSGDTRYGREGYGGGGVAPQQAVGTTETGRAYGTTGGASSGQATPSVRTRAGDTGNPGTVGAGNAVDQSRVRVRGSESSAPPQQSSYPTPNSQPSNPQPRVRERAPSSPPPQQNPNQQPQSNPEPRVRESAPSYNPPPQQNPAPSYNPPPQQSPAPSSPPPQQAPAPRVRHGSVSYEGVYQRYAVARAYESMRERTGFARPAVSGQNYGMPGYQESAPRYEFRGAPSFARSEERVATPAVNESGSRQSSGGRTRH